MRCPILLLFAVAMTATMLAPSAAPVAHACSGGFETIEDARAAITNQFDMVLIGAIVGPRESHVEIKVLTVFKGPIVDVVVLNQPSDLIGTHSSFDPPMLGSGQPDCSYVVRGDPGEQYFLVLENSNAPVGTYRASIFSVAMGDVIPGQYPVYDAALNLPSSGGRPSSGAGMLPMPGIVAVAAMSLLLGAGLVWWGWRERP